MNVRAGIPTFPAKSIRPAAAATQLFALFVVLVLACACRRGGLQSSDGSLRPSEYVALGIPSVSVEWGLREYADCMNILSSLPRHQLPRYRSTKSGAVFDHMLEAHLSLGDKIATFSSTAFTPDTPLLPQLYDSEDPDARASFAGELVVIRSSVLRTVLRVFPNKQEAEEKALKLRLALENATPAGADLVRRQIETTKKQSITIGGIVTAQLIELISLGRDQGVSEDALRELATQLSTIVPEARSYISNEDTQSVREVIREIAGQLDDPEVAGKFAQIANSL